MSAAPKSGNRAALYVRKSKGEDSQQVQSLADQERDLREYAAKHGYVVVRVYSDAFTGTEEHRPGFQRMVQDAESPHRDFDVVLSWDVNRWGRFGADTAGYYRKRLRNAGVRVISMDIPDGRAGRIMRGIKDEWAEWYAEELSRMSMRGAISSARKGRRLGGTPPYGYDYGDFRGDDLVQRLVYDGRKRAEPDALKDDPLLERRLVPSKRARRVKAVGRVFELAADGLGSRLIARTLTAEGYPPPKGRRWHQKTVDNILDNPVYLGHTAWGLRSRAKFYFVTGRQQAERPEEQRGKFRAARDGADDAIVVENTHEPVVTRDVWDRAQRARQANRSLSVRGRANTSDFLLSSLLRCARCGGPMYGKALKNEQGRRYRYYRCLTRHQDGLAACDAPGVTCESLESVLLPALDRYLADSAGLLRRTDFERGLRDGLAVPGAAAPEPPPSGDDVDRQIAELQRRITGDDPDADAATLLEIRRLREQQRKAAAAAPVTPAAAPTRLDVEREVRAALDRVKSWREALEASDPRKRKGVLRQVVAGIEADTKAGQFRARVYSPVAEDSCPLLRTQP